MTIDNILSQPDAPCTQTGASIQLPLRLDIAQQVGGKDAVFKMLPEFRLFWDFNIKRATQMSGNQGSIEQGHMFHIDIIGGAGEFSSSTEDSRSSEKFKSTQYGRSCSSPAESRSNHAEDRKEW